MNILLVEDDARTADLLHQHGLRAEGWRVERAATGPEGLAMARDAARDATRDATRDGAHGAGAADGPTLLVLGLMLPGVSGVSGLEVCQTLRAEGVTLPIPMLTAMTTLEDRVTGLRLGADDDLRKPFEFEELLARLEALARRGRATRARQSPTLTVADLGFGRERILASVWGIHEDLLTNIVDAYSRRLRSKIDEGFEPALIHTQRGLGYRLETLAG